MKEYNMKKWIFIIGCITVFFIGFYIIDRYNDQTFNNENDDSSLKLQKKDEIVTAGTKKYKNFLLDNVLHSQENGDIHYNVYIPDSYDGSESYALYFTLPGYQGLYFQGVGENVKTENFGFIAQDYISKMIVVAPQLNDWGKTSANQTIELVEYFLEHYNIDKTRVYANGYSGGGETMSLVMSKRADLFTAYLHASTQWDGEYESVVENRTPVYIVIGENDEYYGSKPSQNAYDTLYSLYKEIGLSDNEIDKLLVLDLKDSEYFTSQGITNQHGGGALFSNDNEIMGWLFNKKK
ncbi:MAG: prolyl oligopeptidase family serine peptidase [Thomasclavelia ramosa]|nr:prolyl oligopeptidase family serine peptidase [Thomasclavelia ramosa]